MQNFRYTFAANEFGQIFSGNKINKKMSKKKFETLTKAEMQVMNALWEMPDGGCIHDII